ncbi:hypothetical protein C8J57DRAFT_1456962 [Mycena rebaudengoi]|nr:hypothetical protein C8J57DRAFT_1456962 [Mycena rebaudengoi]
MSSILGKNNFRRPVQDQAQPSIFQRCEITSWIRARAVRGVKYARQPWCSGMLAKAEDVPSVSGTSTRDAGWREHDGTGGKEGKGRVDRYGLGRGGGRLREASALGAGKGGSMWKGREGTICICGAAGRRRTALRLAAPEWGKGGMEGGRSVRMGKKGTSTRARYGRVGGKRRCETAGDRNCREGRSRRVGMAGWEGAAGRRVRTAKDGGEGRGGQTGCVYVGREGQGGERDREEKRLGRAGVYESLRGKMGGAEYMKG